ncbi:VOC family protein [Gimibacter soli]|uniref:VOC family protein n=1 Tax=Gimibacter soli TaxID=3024400 RepID=A0AAE9XQ43_9PROT|nr:VOC family protein [Gimibacter soli]WCL54311.1 VOC family protein [Gimibacter soli]
MARMNAVVHFELPYDDRSRMAAFYTKAFGWQTTMLGEEMGNYVLAATAPSGEMGPIDPGAINGGFHPKMPNADAPSVVIEVDEVETAMEAVAAAGGIILGEPMDIPGVGRYVPFTDTEGNRLSMLQPLGGPRECGN